MIQFFAKIWFFFPIALYAQQPSYINYTMNDGLPSNTVYSSMQDSKGYLWFGTDKGVARFDGSKFTVFNTSDGMSDNIVYDIFEDSKKRIWFSCNNGNACYYFNDKFWNKTSDTLLSKLKASSLGLKVLEDKFGNIFILTQFQLFKLSRQNKISEITVKSEGMFSSLIRNSLGEVILLSNEGYYNTNSRKTRLFPSDANNKPVLYSKALYLNDRIYYNHNEAISYFNYSNSTLSLAKIPITEYPSMAQCLQLTEDSNLRVGTQNGLVTYDLKSNKITHKSFDGFSISSFTQDIENNFWMTTLMNGVFLTVNSKVKLLNEKSGLIFNYAGFIDKLNDGTIAIGSNKYLASFVEKGIIHNLRLPLNAGEGKVEKIRIGPDGSIYLAYGVVIIRVNKSNWTSKVLNVSARDIMFIDTSQTILVGGNGVLILNSLDFEEIYRKKLWLSNPAYGQFIPNIKASGIYKGRYTNQIYIYGLFGVKLLKGLRLESILNNHEYLSKNVYRIEETKEGLTCYASNIYGLIITYKSKIFTLNKTNGLRTNIVNSLYIDPKNQIWVSTSEGLCKINYSIQNENLKFTIKNYDQSNGLSTKSINDLTMDDETFYATTDNGVCVFTENNLKLKNIRPLLNIESIAINEKAQNTSLSYTTDYTNNSLRIKYTGLSFSSFGNLKYKYRMKGLENEWKYTQNNILEYPSMPYGEFDFELIVINAKNIESMVKSFHLIINPPFWRTWWFIALSFFTSVFLIFLIVKMRLTSMRKSHETTQQLLYLEKKNIEADKKQALYEKELLEIQNQALRLHMNPHFIFNSINSIQGFYASGDISKAKTYIGKFSSLLRMILDQSKKDFIDINDEIKTIEYYLELNKLRFENKFDYEILVDKSLLKNREEIPPMLIQPFIENSIIHGIAPLKRMGKLIVRIIDDNNYIRCEIEDNGVGREFSRNLNKNRNYESTGIKVTEKRIELNNQTGVENKHVELDIIDVLNSEGDMIGTLVKFSIRKNSF